MHIRTKIVQQHNKLFSAWPRRLIRCDEAMTKHGAKHKILLTNHRENPVNKKNQA